MEKDTSRVPSVISWSAAASWDLCPVAVLVCVEDAFSSRVCSVSGWKIFSSRSVGVAVQLGVGPGLEGILQAPKPLGNPCWQDHAPGSCLLLKCPSQKGWGTP